MAKKIVKSKKIAKAKKAAKKKYKCFMCKASFDSKKGAKMHTRKHMVALKEINLLKEGFVPQETKVGTKFKGKNKIIVS